MSLPCVLVTGGSGVLGTALLPFLLSTYKVIAVGTKISHFPESIRYHKNFKFYERDFTKQQSNEDWGITEDPRIILHFAGIVSGTKASESDYYSVNAKSVQLVTEFAKKRKSKAILVMSSLSVYGYPETTITEETLPMGSSLYAISKLAGEKEFLASGVPGSVFRIASLYGNSTKSAVSKLKRLFLKGFFPLPKPEIVRPYLALEDLILAIKAWIQRVEEGKKIEKMYLLSSLEMWGFAYIFAEFRKIFPANRVLPIPLPLFLVRFAFRLGRVFFPKWGSFPTFLVSLNVDSSASWKKLGISPTCPLIKAYEQTQ